MNECRFFTRPNDISRSLPSMEENHLRDFGALSQYVVCLECLLSFGSVNPEVSSNSQLLFSEILFVQGTFAVNYQTVD